MLRPGFGLAGVSSFSETHTTNMTIPYKKRRLAQALAHQDAKTDAPPIIEITDGPAVPRADDPGLYSAWKFVMVAAPCLLLFLLIYDYPARWLLSEFPEIWGQWEWFQKRATEENRFRQFFFFMPDGLLVTFKITCYSIMVAIPLGIVVGLCRVSKIRFFNFTASVYVEVVRGIPLFVQLYYIYYALGSFIRVPPMVTAVAAISFCYGAYMGEVVRSGIAAIDRGQREAAMSLGFTPFQTMIHVILPQALRTVLPPIGNECIALLKDSSLVSVVAVPDIMRRGRELASTTFASFEIYTTVALIYLFITLLLSKMVSKLETHMGRYERR